MVFISVDQDQQKKMLTSHYESWIENHPIEIDRWAYENLTFESRNEFVVGVNTGAIDPYATYTCISQEAIPDKEKLKQIIDKMLHKRGRIDVILGDVGSGILIYQKNLPRLLSM